ncbi:(R)-mandelonitrile lyase-like [Bidens hawaiensis]|uniref:(R)-mandelonitrile lyase-like n=1 Tax=Bidens hawaiensis TaxID=980011 RepID=UPI004049EFB0
MEARLMDESLVNKSNKWAEKVRVFKPELQKWQLAVRATLVEAGVTPDNGFIYDLIIGTKLAATLFDENGTRHTDAELLQYANPKGLSVLLHATIDALFIVSLNRSSCFIVSCLIMSCPTCYDSPTLRTLQPIRDFFPKMGGFIFEKINGPLSMGVLRIETLNPADNPSVTFNYFNEPEDLQKCVNGIRTILEVVESKAFSNYKYANMFVKDILDLNMKLPVHGSYNTRPTACKCKYQE